jgi:hypothetical protein
MMICNWLLNVFDAVIFVVFIVVVVAVVVVGF